MNKKQALKNWVDDFCNGSFASSADALYELKKMNDPNHWLEGRAVQMGGRVDVNLARKMRSEGMLLREIAAHFGVTKQAVQQKLNESN